MQENICTVIVTFNRKNDLIICLNHVFNQSLLPKAVIIVDNASTDGTDKFLKEKGFIKENNFETINDNTIYSSVIQSSSYQIDVTYLKKNQNSGGSGGFYSGIEYGKKNDHEWFWLMDDDGFPHKNSLENLYNNNQFGDFLNPIVLNIRERDQLSFGLQIKKSRKNIKTYKDAIEYATNNIIEKSVNPFNGTLISKHLIDTIGLPKKEMFIWGDEVEYSLRAAKANLGVLTIVNSIHFHPEGRVKSIYIFNKRLKLNFQDNKLKDYCDFRNSAYIKTRYGFKLNLLVTILLYTINFISKSQYSNLFFYYRSTIDGIFAKWGQEKKFLLKPI